MLHVVRFLSGFLRHPRTRVVEDEVGISVKDADIPATLFRPPGDAPLPGWLVLHGITVPGRHHAMLTRFARALAASGGTVIIPEITPWKELRIDTYAADATIAAAAAALAGRPDVLPGGISLVGFSFGATQALVTAAHDQGSDQIRSVVGFGGYCDLATTLHFMMTGEHEWGGISYRLEPDPYGRWIVAANYLTRASGYGDMAAVATAAAKLAAEAGRIGAYAADPLFDPFKAELRSELDPVERRIWDLLAPPIGTDPNREAARELAGDLVQTALREDPALNPMPILPHLRKPLVLAHGQADQLIPFSETLRLRSLLPPDAPAHTYITRLFAHSTEVLRFPAHRYPIEIARYLQLLRRALARP
ncbi:hypothetical protein BH23GEM6_BH23GEM6_06810 [soil metagenome]